MIHALASFFRGIHIALGATAIPPDASHEEERKFVFMWMIFVAIGIVWIGVLAYLLLR